jgi:methionyl-tRNA formyltransferase
MAEEQGLPILNIGFMGTPDFAAEILKHLLAYDGVRVQVVYSQPDRPCGRGQVCRPTPVKALALEHGVEVRQPVNFKDPAEIEALEDRKLDLLVVAAYGLILPARVLNAAQHGAMNVHASLLPKYRGAAPIQRAIMAGDPMTGVTIMQMDVGMDTGDMLLSRALGIGIDETAQDIHDQLAKLGGEMIVETIELLRKGTIGPIAQDDAKATYAPKLTKDEGAIDWNRPAREIHNQIRALTPWPGAFFEHVPQEGGKPIRLTVLRGAIGPELAEPVAPGTLLGLEGDDLLVACADRAYRIKELKPAGKKAMSGRAFFCGYLAGTADQVEKYCKLQ